MINWLRRCWSLLRVRLGLMWVRRVQQELAKDAAKRSDFRLSILRYQAEVDGLRRFKG